MPRKTNVRPCTECGANVTGHSSATLCRSCASRKAYFDRNGKPPEKIIGKCPVCEKEFVDYATNRRNSKSGLHFCSSECRSAYVGVQNSVRNGGDAVIRTKKERDALYYRENSDKVRKNARDYYNNNKEKKLRKSQEKDRKLKQEIIDAYGGKCVCCGETIFEFLTIDHVNGDGAEHRRRIGGKGRKLYEAIKEEGFPQDRYRLLCLNCNISRGFYGYCPHDPDDISSVSHVPFNPGRKRTVA